MFENDHASTGNLTVRDLRRLLKGLPGDAVVHLAVEGFEHQPLTCLRFEKPQYPDEGEIGSVLVEIDPFGSFAQALVAAQGEK
jgi:hypothetical protein